MLINENVFFFFLDFNLFLDIIIENKNIILNEVVSFIEFFVDYFLFRKKVFVKVYY